MLKLLLLSVLLQSCLSIDRNDVLDEYQPILDEKSKNFTDSYTLISKESQIIKTQLTNATLTTMALMNTQITTLKSVIAEAKAQAVNQTTVLNCIKVQETAANALNTVAINATCLQSFTYTDLDAATTAFKTLATIPAVTVSACTQLDPLPTQDDIFLDCLTDKILDLDKQTALLDDSFTAAKTSTIDENVACLSEQSGLIAQKINEIHFQVTLCLTVG